MSLVSVLIPTYNREHLILRAVQSALRQTYSNLECIVIDDGSTDNTLNLLKTVEDHRLKVVSLKTNSGVSHARNVGFKKSEGDYIALLDSDDEWEAVKLEKQIPLLKKFNLVHGEEVWIRNGKRINQKKVHRKSGGDIFERCLHLCLISPSASVMKRSLYEEMKGFREDFPVCEDYELWLRITSQHQVGFVDDPILIKYGGHEDQLSRKYFAMDYWRVKAMFELKNSGTLSKEQVAQLEVVLQKKCEILKMGYIKHKNTKDLPYIENVLRSCHQ